MNSSDHPQTDNHIVTLHYSAKESAATAPSDDKQLTQYIMASARQHGFELAIDIELTTRLARGSLSPEIPAELYQAAALVLAFVWNTSS